MQRDWKEPWIDQMGLIVALSGKERFEMMEAFKLKMFVTLTQEAIVELKEALRQRFTPSSNSGLLPKDTQPLPEHDQVHVRP